ncbi:MAG: hypothetical protein IPO38_09510 [Rhodocyclaceae bacterium]|nr:hypothetical protein [Rhodocyclaceae bacterium]
MNNISLWYQFAIKQIAAESYIDRQARWTDARLLREDLERNTNWISNAATDKLYTKMSESQAIEFAETNLIIAHQPNTASCFSATLTKDNSSGEYTLSFRSTEYKDRTGRQSHTGAIRNQQQRFCLRTDCRHGGVLRAAKAKWRIAHGCRT